MSDPAKYRTKEEVEEYKKKDPLEMVKATLVGKKMATEADIEAMEEKVMLVVNEAVEFSENSPFPEPSALYEDIYAEPNYPFIRE
jgi:pyruvate dehydrogenase E1 component alpha subunit